MAVKDVGIIINSLFNARSIAVIGASNNPSKFGFMVLKNIIDAGYNGILNVVHPTEKQIQGINTYSEVSKIPGDLDLLVVIVPANKVIEVVRQGIEKKAIGAIIISSGFREAGRIDLETDLIKLIQNTNFRIIGPNIQGINYIPNKLCAVISPLILTQGPIAVISQSGSVSATVSEWAELQNIGISGMVNVGNQVDLCESDFLNYFVNDTNTKVIMLYLEGPKEGSYFKQTIQDSAFIKPIVVLKPGRTAGGFKTAASHTASIAGNDRIFDTACRQYGLVREYSIESFFDTAKALAMMPLPKGNRILIVTSSGGVASLTVDEAESKGLQLPLLPNKVVEEINKVNKISTANISNPLDLPSWVMSHWRDILQILNKHSLADIVLFVIADPVPDIERNVIEFASKKAYSVAAVYMGGGKHEIVGTAEMQKAGIPVFPSPERAIRSIEKLVWYASQLKNIRKENIDF